MPRPAVVLFGLIALTALATAEPVPPPATFAPVVQRFLTRPDEPLVEYRGTRYLKGRNERVNLSAWMEVATVLAAGRFHYQVMGEGGSEAIRRRVFRSMLDGEVQAFATGDAGRSSFTPANYELTPAATSEVGLVKLLAHPRRRDVTLIEGAVFITDTDADLVRVEGRLAKNPSFWTRRVEVVKQYGRIGGLRVPVRLDSTAQVRLAGTSTLTMTYDYEMINGTTLTPARAIASR